APSSPLLPYTTLFRSELALDLKHLTPVGEFDALGAAVELLRSHRSGRIVIVGDFDADGATSAALAYLTLRALGFASVDYFIPDRSEEHTSELQSRENL